MSFFDDLETRSADQRANDLGLALPAQIANAQKLSGYSNALGGVDASAIQTIEDLAGLPVLRKSDLVQAQSENDPLGGYGALNTHEFAHIFQSPGPIYEPGGVGHDWWRIGRFLNAVGIGAGDIVQNCFGYHLTPAGMIFENGYTLSLHDALPMIGRARVGKECKNNKSLNKYPLFIAHSRTFRL